MRKRRQDSEGGDRPAPGAAREEMSHYGEFDYVIVNEVFETAVAEMQHLHRQPAAQGRPGGTASGSRESWWMTRTSPADRVSF